MVSLSTFRSFTIGVLTSWVLRLPTIRHCRPKSGYRQVESSLREMMNREIEGAMELNQAIKGCVCFDIMPYS